MPAYQEFFKGKKITVLGLGLLGRGVGDTEFLAQMGGDVLVTDKKDEAELKDSVEKLRKYPNVSFVLGGHRIDDFIHCDMVVKAAGVPLASPEISAAHRAGIPVYMSTALFAKFAHESGAKIVGITGTRGKSTVTYMIYHSLINAGRKAILGGNVRGISTLSLLPQVQKDTICVLEIDSWQLQGFGELQISPDVSVFTNLLPDHLNYYPNMKAYFDDKANIFRFQAEEDTLVVGDLIIEQVRAEKPRSKLILPPPIPFDLQLLVPGEHNRTNAAFAASALRVLGLTEEEIRSGLESFQGVEGRLQFVREINKVKIYNDNNATTPEATIAALSSFPERTIVLIAGGSDKGLDLDELVQAIQRTCKRVILLKGTGTDRLHPHLEANVHEAIAEALKEAMSSATPGDVVLFSPAFASFGIFKNEYDRNDQFVALVKALA